MLAPPTSRSSFRTTSPSFRERRGDALLPINGLLADEQSEVPWTKPVLDLGGDEFRKGGRLGVAVRRHEHGAGLFRGQRRSRPGRPKIRFVRRKPLFQRIQNLDDPCIASIVDAQG